MDDELIQTVLDINLISVIKGCREAVKVMKPQGSGQIVNVSSGCAHYSWPAWGTYTAAKAGMVAFTRCLHKEMAEWGGKASSFVPAQLARISATLPGLRMTGLKVSPVRKISPAPWSIASTSPIAASSTKPSSGAPSK